jgi:hypothetical protein
VDPGEYVRLVASATGRDAEYVRTHPSAH